MPCTSHLHPALSFPNRTLPLRIYSPSDRRGAGRTRQGRRPRGVWHAGRSLPARGRARGARGRRTRPMRLKTSRRRCFCGPFGASAASAARRASRPGCWPSPGGRRCRTGARSRRACGGSSRPTTTTRSIRRRPAGCQDQALADLELQRAVARGVRTLPAKYREALMLFCNRRPHVRRDEPGARSAGRHVEVARLGGAPASQTEARAAGSDEVSDPIDEALKAMAHAEASRRFLRRKSAHGSRLATRIAAHGGPGSPRRAQHVALVAALGWLARPTPQHGAVPVSTSAARQSRHLSRRRRLSSAPGIDRPAGADTSGVRVARAARTGQDNALDEKRSRSGAGAVVAA